MILHFLVPGHVQAKERHRTAALKRCMACNRVVIGWPCKYCGHSKLEFVANVSTPGKKSETYESFVALCAREAMGVNPVRFTGPVSIQCKFYFEIPVSRRKHLQENDWHLQRPDVDNCKKSVLDSCNGLVFQDDCIVAKITAEKRWTLGCPRAEIHIESLEPANPEIISTHRKRLENSSSTRDVRTKRSRKAPKNERNRESGSMDPVAGRNAQGCLPESPAKSEKSGESDRQTSFEYLPESPFLKSH